jgi:hypothetical protein
VLVRIAVILSYSQIISHLVDEVGTIQRRLRQDRPELFRRVTRMTQEVFDHCQIIGRKEIAIVVLRSPPEVHLRLFERATGSGSPV